MKTVAILTEASNDVGTGHMYESIALAAELISNGYDVLFLANRDAPDTLLRQIPFAYEVYGKLTEDKILRSAQNDRNDCKCVVTNLRKIDNKCVETLKSDSLTSVVCIDELGHRLLDCNVIINALIDDDYHHYEDSRAVMYLGPKYMIMKPDFAKLRDVTAKIRKNIEVISICMGGSDISGTTLKLLHWMSDTHVRINVIVGGGFLYHKELEGLLDQLTECDAVVLKNIPNVAEVFKESDIAFCAGGNTLYELACLGIPALTVYEAPHEKSSSETFQKQGFGVCVGHAGSVLKKDVLSAIARLDYNTRLSHKEAGMNIVDGMGLHRVVEVVGGFYE